MIPIRIVETVRRAQPSVKPWYAQPSETCSLNATEAFYDGPRYVRPVAALTPVPTSHTYIAVTTHEVTKRYPLSVKNKKAQQPYIQRGGVCEVRRLSAAPDNVPPFLLGLLARPIDGLAGRSIVARSYAFDCIAIAITNTIIGFRSRLLHVLGRQADLAGQHRGAPRGAIQATTHVSPIVQHSHARWQGVPGAAHGRKRAE